MGQQKNDISLLVHTRVAQSDHESQMSAIARSQCKSRRSLLGAEPLSLCTNVSPSQTVAESHGFDEGRCVAEAEQVVGL